MRSKIGKALRSKFRKRLLEVLPSLEPVSTIHVPQGCTLYGWRISDDLTYFLRLLVDSKSDSFTIEVAWSRGGHFPSGIEEDPHKPRSNDEHIFRLCSFWSPKEDIWWQLAEPPSMSEFEQVMIAGTTDEFVRYLQEDHEEPIQDVLPRIDEMVNDAVKRILDFAVPYFEELSNKFGCAQSWQKKLHPNGFPKK